MQKLYEFTGHELLESYQAEEAAPEEVVNAIYDRIEVVDGKVKAYVLKDRRRALSQVDKALPLEELGRSIPADKGADGKFKGIPVAIKDNICVKDEETTCASRILKGFRPPYDATVVQRLKSKGAILLGKVNMDEFAFGSSCETSCYGPTHNPWSLERIPGGSSGGASAAVACEEATMALGSDTGGSIRQPASLCGVVGLKPTYGRVSRYGLIAFASSLDQIGPITKDVQDAALLMNVIAGYDEMDSTSVALPVPDYTRNLLEDVKGMKIGIPKEYFVAGLDKDVEGAVRKAIRLLKDLGATLIEISLPHTDFAVSCYYIIATAEASSNLARFDGVQYGHRHTGSKNLLQMYEQTRAEGFGPEAKRRIILGTYALSSGYYEAYYLKAQKVRTLIKEDFDKAFEACDVLVTPTSPTTAFKLGERMEDPLTMYLSDIFTIPANLAGIPGISIPCGFSKEELPIGLQLLARPFAEETLFRVAYTYEKNTDWHKRRPKI